MSMCVDDDQVTYKKDDDQVTYKKVEVCMFQYLIDGNLTLILYGYGSMYLAEGHNFADI